MRTVVEVVRVKTPVSMAFLGEILELMNDEYGNTTVRHEGGVVVFETLEKSPRKDKELVEALGGDL